MTPKKSNKFEYQNMMACGGCSNFTSPESDFTCKHCGRMLCGKCGDLCNDHKQLPESICFLNKETGDLFIINYLCNIPIGENWVEISRNCYDVISGNIFNRKD